MVVSFGLASGSCLVHFCCSNLFISGIDYYTRHEVFGSLRGGFFMGFVLVLFYLYNYGTLHMQHFCNSWRVRNLLVMVLRFNKFLKSAESIMSLHTRLLRPSTNVHSSLQCILHCSRVVNNAREDSFLLSPNFMAKEVHLGQVAT